MVYTQKYYRVIHSEGITIYVSQKIYKRSGCSFLIVAS